MSNITQVFYGDGSVVEFAPGVPTRNVQAILQPHLDVGAEIVTGGDYYVFEDGHWRAVDIFGLFDFLMDTGLVLFGRTINSEEYYKIMKYASDVKNGWLCYERHK